MSKKLRVFLAIALGWAAGAGAVLHLTGTDLGSVQGIVLITLLYMPSPLVAAAIAERGLVKRRFTWPRGGLRPVLTFLLTPAAAVIAFVMLHLTAIFIGGDILGVPAFGSLEASPSEILEGAASRLDPDPADPTVSPPPLLVLMAALSFGALIAGWTVNGLAAIGEEYGWRGLMWDELKHLGALRANLITGIAWGLWHAPLIIQGYNFPGRPILGVLAMVVFCVAMSPLLSAIGQRTSSLLPVAAAHGMFNALAALLLVLAPEADPILAGPLGLLGSALLLILGLSAWSSIRRAPTPEGTVPSPQHSVGRP